MTIRDLEILLYTLKHDKEKCDEVCNQIVTGVKGLRERETIGAILEKLGLISNHHLEKDMDFFAKIMGQLQELNFGAAILASKHGKKQEMVISSFPKPRQ